MGLGDVDSGPKFVKSCSTQRWIRNPGVPATNYRKRESFWNFHCVIDTSFVSEATYGRVCVGRTEGRTETKVVKYVVTP